MCVMMVGTIIASQVVVTNLCWHELPQFIQNLSVLLSILPLLDLLKTQSFL